MRPSSSSFVERVLGAIQLKPATYEEIEHDTDATWQAVLVVAVAAVLSGVGSSRGRTNDLLGGILTALLFWALYALFVYLVGAYLLRGPETSATFGEVLRVLGFSYAPAAFGVLGFVPVAGPIIVFIAGIWSLVASIVAMRQALEVSTGRAVAIAVVAFLAMVVVVVIIVTVLGVSIAGVNSLMPRNA